MVVITNYRLFIFTVGVLICCTGCYPDTSSKEWNEPIHFRVVINDAGWCQPIISGKKLKKRDVAIRYFDAFEKTSTIICPNIFNQYPRSPFDANIVIDARRKDTLNLGKFVEKDKKRTQILKYPDDIHLSIGLSGKGSMGSLTCLVSLSQSSLKSRQETKFEINTGDSKDTHVLVGLGNRVCTF